MSTILFLKLYTVSFNFTDSNAAFDAGPAVQLPQHGGRLHQDHPVRGAEEHGARDERCGWRRRPRARHVLRLLREDEEGAESGRSTECHSPRYSN